MQKTLSFQNRPPNYLKINLLVATFGCSLLVYMPIIAMIFFILLGVFYFRSIVPLYISLTLLFAIVASLNDPSGRQIGDVVRYYEAYSTSSYIETLSSLKIFRFAVFLGMAEFEVNERFYPFVSFLGLFTTLFFVIYRLQPVLNIDMEKVQNRLLLIVILLSVLPFWVLASFENTFSFSVAMLAIYFLFNGKFLVSILFQGLALTIHLASLPVIVIAYLSLFSKNSGLLSLLIKIVLLLCGLLIVSIFKIETGLGIVDFVLIKIHSYATGPWSKYVGGSDFVLLIYIFAKLVFAFLLLLMTKSAIKEHSDSFHLYWRFLLIYFCISVYFLFFRTLGLRYVYIGGLFFLPIILWGLLSLKVAQGKKMLIFVFTIFFIFSIPNISEIFSFISRADRPMQVITGSWEQILNYNLEHPQELKYDIERSKLVE